MAEALKQRLDEALQKVAAVQAGPPSSFHDGAGDALNALRRAVIASVKSDSDILTAAQSRAEMQDSLRFLLRSADKKPRRGQVLECLKGLLSSKAWVQSTKCDEDLKASALSFLRTFPDNDTAELQSALESADTGHDGTDSERELIAPSFGDDEERELTMRSLMDGFSIMQKLHFEYPTGRHSEVPSDRAIEGLSAFYKGIARLDCKFAPGATEDGPVTIPQNYQEILSTFDADWPNILHFLRTVHEARKPYRGQVRYVVDKVAKVSEACRLARTRIGMPWEPLAHPAENPERVPREAFSDQVVEEVSLSPVAPAVAPPVQSILQPGSRASVIWLDGRKEAYKEARMLVDAGLKVQGVHDDYQNPDNTGPQDALSYAIDATTDPNDHLVAIVVNRGDTHKKFLRDVTWFCEKHGRLPPFYAACTAKGKIGDFDEDQIKFLHKDRIAIQKAVIEEYDRRKAAS